MQPSSSRAGMMTDKSRSGAAGAAGSWRFLVFSFQWEAVHAGHAVEGEMMNVECKMKNLRRKR
jgi:hypothetical protein